MQEMKQKLSRARGKSMKEELTGIFYLKLKVNIAHLNMNLDQSNLLFPVKADVWGQNLKPKTLKAKL